MGEVPVVSEAGDEWGEGEETAEGVGEETRGGCCRVVKEFDVLYTKTLTRSVLLGLFVCGFEIVMGILILLYLMLSLCYDPGIYLFNTSGISTCPFPFPSSLYPYSSKAAKTRGTATAVPLTVCANLLRPPFASLTRVPSLRD